VFKAEKPKTPPASPATKQGFAPFVVPLLAFIFWAQPMANNLTIVKHTNNDALPDIIGNIVYLIPIEDADPYKASLLQGFAPSLLENSQIIHAINLMPSDIWELTPSGLEVRIARRMSGQASIRWFGQSPTALTSQVTPIFHPFIVVFFHESHQRELYDKWIKSHPFPLTVVANDYGTISHTDFSIFALQSAFLCICDAIRGQVQDASLDEAQKAIQSWREPEARKLHYQVGGHNSVMPNLLALHAAGFREMEYGAFQNIKDGIDPYVHQIALTTRSIFEERLRVGERRPNQYFRRPPSLNLFAPAIYSQFREMPLGGGSLKRADLQSLHTARRVLERQEGYSFRTNTVAQARVMLGSDPDQHPRPHILMRERSAELALATDCMGTLAASEISAVIRLPNAVNRTAGQVRQFAQQYHTRRSTPHKRMTVFRRVQNAITASIPAAFIEFIEEANEGIRIVADAHLEWLKIRGLPLCAQKDVTRIPVPPGNFFADQVRPSSYIHLFPEDFRNVLIINALHKEDPISRCFDVAMRAFGPYFSERVQIHTVRAHRMTDFVESLNAFEGAMLIFDGHGRHEPGNPAKLRLLDEEIDTWELQKIRPRVPPIVILSACDTHAADRNHASAANGFLASGARTVLASVFPIDARDASSFVGRLLYRVAEFVPTAHDTFGRSLTWMEIIGGMIRMQLLTDFCKRLEGKRVIDSAAYKEVHAAGNIAINALRDWPFEEVVGDLHRRGLDENMLWHELLGAAANSTAISYLQTGRPETIIVHPDEPFTEEA